MMTPAQCRAALAAAGYNANEISCRADKRRVIVTIRTRVPEWVVREICPEAEIQYAQARVDEFAALAAERVVGALPVGSEVTCQMALNGKMPLYPDGGRMSCDLRSPDRYRLIRLAGDAYRLETWGGRVNSCECLVDGEWARKAPAHVRPDGEWRQGVPPWVLTGTEAASALAMLHLRCGAMAILRPPDSWIKIYQENS